MNKTTRKAVYTAIKVLGGLLILSAGRRRGRSNYTMNETTYKDQILTHSAEVDSAISGISKRLGIPVNYLMLHLNHESGFDPSAHVDYNKETKKHSYGLSGPVSPSTIGGGLFGLMRKFAKPPILDKGMTFEDFMRLDVLGQLPYFERSIKPYASKIREFADMRMAGFSPKYLGYPDDAIMYTDDPENPKDAYSANYWLDIDKDGKISVGEVKNKWRNDYNKKAAVASKRGKPSQIRIK